MNQTITWRYQAEDHLVAAQEAKDAADEAVASGDYNQFTVSRLQWEADFHRGVALVYATLYSAQGS